MFVSRLNGNTNKPGLYTYTLHQTYQGRAQLPIKVGGGGFGLVSRSKILKNMGVTGACLRKSLHFLKICSSRGGGPDPSDPPPPPPSTHLCTPLRTVRITQYCLCFGNVGYWRQCQVGEDRQVKTGLFTRTCRVEEMLSYDFHKKV